MLKIKRLEISNIGRFVGSHVIDFSDKSGLIQIDAYNKNTGGSSGSGKSTIFNALEYLLGINSLPATVLQSRLTKSSMAVSGIFDWEGKELEIVRSKSDGLTIKVGGAEIVSGNNKIAEERLDEILSIPRDLLRKMIHKRQKEGGFFLNLTPKETHNFLVEALDLKTWSDRSEKVELEIKDLSQQLTLANNEIAHIGESMSSLESSISSMQEPVLGWDKSMLNILETALEKASEHERGLLLAMSSELALIDKPSQPAPQDRSALVPLKNRLLELKALDAAEKKKLMDRLQEATKELSALQIEFRNLLASIEIGRNAESKLENLKNKIVSIKNSSCPTCKQHWTSGQEELERLIEEARKTTEQISIGKKAEEALPRLNMAVEDKHSQVRSMQNELAGPGPLSSQIVEMEKKISLETERLDRELALINQAYQEQILLVMQKESAIRAKYEDKIAAASYNTREQAKLYAQKKAELDSYLASLELYNKNTEVLKKSKEDLAAKLTSKLTLKRDLEDKIGIAKDALTLIRSYTNSLFQSALDQIAHRASDILSKIPNMSTASIYFEGFKETKTGGIKEEVSAILTMDGEINIPVKSMSGGERTAIDLAVDLAVVDMVESLAGKGLDLFILDEPFDGLDSICREQSLEVLKAYITDKKIIVVDHSNETKEMVSNRFFVVRDGQESQIRDTLS